MGALLPILSALLELLPLIGKKKAIAKPIKDIVDSIIDSQDELEGSDGITTGAPSNVWQALLTIAKGSRWVLYAAVGLLLLSWVIGVMQVSFVWAIFS